MSETASTYSSAYKFFNGAFWRQLFRKGPPCMESYSDNTHKTFSYVIKLWLFFKY